jgi:hypothetical protein
MIGAELVEKRDFGVFEVLLFINVYGARF